jgi:diketogulonate reductase-like aldo/keto reductase
LNVFQIVKRKNLDKGDILSIGVSNFEPRHIEELLQKVNYPPTVNQCEFHPHLCRPELKKYCQEKGIFLQVGSKAIYLYNFNPFKAHTSLANNSEELYNSPIIKGLSAKYSISIQVTILNEKLCVSINFYFLAFTPIICFQTKCWRHSKIIKSR